MRHRGCQFNRGPYLHAGVPALLDKMLYPAVCLIYPDALLKTPAPIWMRVAYQSLIGPLCHIFNFPKGIPDIDSLLSAIVRLVWAVLAFQGGL